MEQRKHIKVGLLSSLLLALVMVLGILPLQAFAAEENVDAEDYFSAQDNIDAEDYPAAEDYLLAEDTVAFGQNEYHVYFDPDDGVTELTDFYHVQVAGGDTIQAPPDPVWGDKNATRVYTFAGWYSYTDENDEPVFWDFDKDTVESDTMLWAAWEESCRVAFDPDDGKTQYQDFYKTTVPVGGTVTDIPEDPVRGKDHLTRTNYTFKGWYAYLDENGEPELWDFEKDTVQENTTLWAAWEENCIVAFDPDDGVTQYEDFYKTIVPLGGKITDVPEGPTRPGYIFKGWYAYLDENLKPIPWDYEKDTVQENTTLWPVWEEGCLVVFDPDDGKTEYPDFYKTTVPIGGTVKDRPENPTRDGYVFKGWYAYLDENDEPVFWDFDKDTVMENTTLWAAWEVASEPGPDPDPDPDKPGPVKPNPDKPGPDKPDPNKPDPGEGKKPGLNPRPQIDKVKTPPNVKKTGGLPQTGDNSLLPVWLWSGLLSLTGMTALFVTHRKKKAE